MSIIIITQLLPTMRPNTQFKQGLGVSMVTYSFFRHEMTPEDEAYLFLFVDVDVATSPLVNGNGASRLAN